MSFDQVIREHFVGAVDEAAFVSQTLSALSAHGFSAANAIACVAVCRDELCTPLQREVRDVWGEAFDMSCLAGVVSCGKTGFGAAHAHSPTEQERERYVYFSMAHIGIGPGGEPGQCTRVGRSGTSTACGALCAVLGELHSGQVAVDHDPDDMEQALLRHKLLQRLAWGARPDLPELTRLAQREGLATMERMIALTTDPAKSDHAMFSGIQIHGPDQRSLVWPAVSYAVVDGVRVDVQVT